MGSLGHLKEKAILLRKAGYSYSQILKSLELKSKGTLSAWFKDITLGEESLKKLESNNKLATIRGLKRFNVERSNRISKENELARLAGVEEIGSISERELMLIGASLYWGEGTKAENKSSTKRIAFTNSDPHMIAVFIKFLREVWGISDSDIYVGVHIYPTIDPDKAKEYWSEIINLPPDKFYIVKQVSRSSWGKRPYNSLPHGTAVIKVRGRLLFFKMKGLISGVVSRAL